MLRRAVFLVHEYLGYTIGIYFIVICATGALLILLENRIDNFLDYPVRHVPVAPTKKSLAEMLASVEQRYPDSVPRLIVQSCESGCTYVVRIRYPDLEERDVLVDPYLGTVVGSSVWSQTPVGALYNFHANLLAGDKGSKINSFVGLAAVLQVLCGLYLWPGWRKLERGFSIKWRADQWRLNFDIHKVLGIVCATFFVYIVLTGAAGVLMPEPKTAGESMSISARASWPLPIDALVAKANKALAGRITMIYPPTSSTSVLRVRKVVAGDPDPYGWSYIVVDPYSGKILQVDDATKWPLWARMYTYYYPLHIGSLGGYPLRYLFIAFALAPIFLYYTAFLMWLNRLRRDEAVAAGRLKKISASSVVP